MKLTVIGYERHRNRVASLHYNHNFMKILKNTELIRLLASSINAHAWILCGRSTSELQFLSLLCVA